MKKIVILFFIFVLNAGIMFANAEYNFQLHRIKTYKKMKMNDLNQKIRDTNIHIKATSIDSSVPAKTRQKELQQLEKYKKYLEAQKEKTKLQYKTDKARLKSLYK